MSECKKKFTIKDNNVSSKGQLGENNLISYYGNAQAKKRILIVGNSITRHGKKPEIGWHGDFGMAASAAEKDYVHLLASRILSREEAFIMVHQLAEWERKCTEDGVLTLLEDARAFAPDLLIFRLGENVTNPKREDAQAILEGAFASFVDCICPKRVIFTTCFWHHGVLDDAIRVLAKRMNMPLVELGDLGDDDRYMAVGLFEHSGVAHHPGDLGMEEIAERIYQAYQALEE